MKIPRVIFESPCRCYRILEVQDESFTLEDLKGDTFKPECVPHLDADTLKREETEFENQVEIEGVFGYILERWNESPGVGYESLDSCFGFVGRYKRGSPEFDHYIVKEFKNTIEERTE